VAMSRVSVSPGILRWARQRSGLDVADLIRKFPKLADWEAGQILPTMRQLEGYARATHTPVGYLFLPTPPEEILPLPDFRTFNDRAILTPSPDLLDTIYGCEQRQEWYRGYAEENGAEPVTLVDSFRLDMNPVEVAAQLREIFSFGLDRRAEFPTWIAALGGLRVQVEAVGVLVMINGVVDSNTHRKLNPDEFRGFALVDELAPLVFINGADTKAAQIFTLAHELAHVALGGSALSRPDMRNVDETGETELWCNRVAAEFLVPLTSLSKQYVATSEIEAELSRLARYYKVSTLVVLRRIFDAGLIDATTYHLTYEFELSRLLAFIGERPSGGNFYNTQPVRFSKRFARAVISDTLEGKTSHRDAFRLLGFKKFSTFEELTHQLGVA
jgi:Zn-dependent peptidase ImmA (M78 family)